MINVNKKENESTESLIRRFNRRVLQTGIIKEAKSKRNHPRKISRNMRRKDAISKKVYLASRPERPANTRFSR
jgi:ribosomal protein S21